MTRLGGEVAASLGAATAACNRRFDILNAAREKRAG